MLSMYLEIEQTELSMSINSFISNFNEILIKFKTPVYISPNLLFNLGKFSFINNSVIVSSTFQLRIFANGIYFANLFPNTLNCLQNTIFQR